VQIQVDIAETSLSKLKSILRNTTRGEVSL
jgi:hypothetical protein